MDERIYYLGFSVFPGVGPKRFAELLNHFGSAKGAWDGNEGEVCRVLGKVYGNNFLQFRKTFSLRDYEAKLKKSDVWFITRADKDFPSLLSEIENPPIILYGKGDYEILNQVQDDKTIAIVGTRKITHYGRQVTEMITEELVRAGCVIVSGLAMGVDVVAHKTTIENGGKTIAVLGSGVDVCHPSSNQGIYNSIIAGAGAVVSEYPLSEPPSKGSFPSRNRIIAGLSQAVVVTEGAENSGALYTAKDALKNNRLVFAVPGPITSMLSKGPNSLLAKGAKLVTNGSDVLDALGVKASPPSHHEGVLLKLRRAKGETEEEQKIIDLLQNESLQFDEVVRKTGYDSSKTSILLSILEMRGIVYTSTSGYSLT